MEPIDEDELKRFIAMVEDFYRFVVSTYEKYSAPRDYGTGQILNMVEMHTLAMIAAEPGVCVTDIAKRWQRTLGAASRNVDRLCAKGYVEKRKLPGNAKTVHAYPTEQGAELARLHAAYDRTRMAEAAQILLAHHTREELNAFYQVLQTVAELEH